MLFNCCLQYTFHDFCLVLFFAVPFFTGRHSSVLSTVGYGDRPKVLHINMEDTKVVLVYYGSGRKIPRATMPWRKFDNIGAF